MTAAACMLLRLCLYQLLGRIMRPAGKWTHHHRQLLVLAPTDAIAKHATYSISCSPSAPVMKPVGFSFLQASRSFSSFASLMPLTSNSFCK